MSDTIVLPQSPVAGPKPGDLIAGKYRLERELGRGAMGTVWSAVHTTLAQRVAIKLIAGEKAQSSEARLRFSVEAKAAARLRSRHVVQVYDDGETPAGEPYIVMEYLEGKTLEERLEDPDIGLGEAVRITTHVGRALARAHAQGIVHRDLKSGNIFLAKTEDDELGWVAKVLDFGVAKVLTEVSAPSTTKTGTIVGTPLFMSPEQIRGAAHVDHRADLYSLGIVFYNMVTGSHAFDGPSYSDVLVAICTQKLPDIRVAAPWLPPALGAWFDKACARDREARFQSADEMIEALQQAAGPSARLGRPSFPEEIGGPSGTLVGHVSPETAATLVAAGVKEPASVRAGAPERSVASERTGPSVDATVALRPEPARARAALGGLWLWAASGAGVALVTAGVGLAVLYVATPRAAAPPVETQVLQTVVAPEPQPLPPPPRLVASALAAPEPSAETAPPLAPAPSTRSASADHPSSAHRVSGSRRPSLPVAAENPAAAPRAASTTPDMGF